MPDPYSPASAHVRGLGTLVLSTALLLGCAATPYRAAQPEPRPLGRDLVAYEAPLAAEEPSVAGAALPQPSPTKPLSLADALALASAQSPHLAAASWEVRAREGRALQAGLRPNPEIAAELEEFAGTGSLSGFDATESTLIVAQRIETARKRPRRRKAAEIHADVAAWEREAIRLSVVTSVARAFYEVLAAQERIALMEELVAVARSSLDATARLVSAGASPPVERVRAEIEVSTLEVDLATTRRALGAARADLAASWDGTSTSFGRVVGSLGDTSVPPSLDSARSWLAGNPELLLWEHEIARREAVVELESARRIPDVTFGAGIKYLAGVDDAGLVAGVSLPLPVFGRNQGNLAAARSDLHRARHERRATEVRLAAELERAHQELAARHEEARELRASILPRAREAYEGVRRGYTQGRFRSVDILDAQRRLFELRLREVDALRAYHAAEADLQELTGTSWGPDGVTGEEPKR